MDEKTLEELDYFRIRKEIEGMCVSEEGARKISQRMPFGSADKGKCDRLKRMAREWTAATKSRTSASLQSWSPVGQSLRILRAEGSVLGQEQLFSVLTFAKSSLDAFAGLRSTSKEAPIGTLRAVADSFSYESISSALRSISRIIDWEGKVRDIHELREIRTRIAGIKGEISSALRRYTSDPSMNAVLSSNVPAFRADRQVLAVRSQQRLKVPGIVHEVSQSGQTLFIEPEEVVRKNNELLQEEFRLQEETRKIFRQTTDEIRPHADDLADALEKMSELDAARAAALWGIGCSCAFAADALDDNPPELVHARHPLLTDRAVPIDVKFLGRKNVLIITGPNTGGKTVAIKTFAILSLLNQAGFPVTADEGTSLPFFDSIYADIGDEQSIDKSLSTFSAHMRNIASAVRHADAKSLVLLDELGSGTDPQEGGAIAMAVLDALIEKDSFVLATTHHGIIKNYAHANERCVNASAEFDPGTLSPTYRILIGVPGESHALEIAEKSGIPAETVGRAREYITGGDADVSRLISALTQKHVEAERIRKELSARETEARALENRLRHLEVELSERENAITEREMLSESRFLREARSRMENLVRELREGEITREKNLKVRSFLDSLSEEEERKRSEAEAERERVEEEKKRLSAEERILGNGMRISARAGTGGKSSKKTRRRMSNREALEAAKSDFTDEEARSMSERLGSVKDRKRRNDAPHEFVEGAEVISRKSRMRGVLARKSGDKKWFVQFGSLRMEVQEKELMCLGFPNITTRGEYSVELSSGGDAEGSLVEKDDSPKFELRLLGMREEEALKALQRQLDLCVLKDLKSFSVIHGKGSGILQQAVHDYLSHYPAVKDFSFARTEDGGFGKTYVEML